MSRPLIGVTIGYSDNREIFSLRDDYVRAVETAGGLPVILAPGAPADAPEMLGRLDGLVLSGGVDVDPTRYGEPPHEAVRQVIPERDAFELGLCRGALERDLPLLAICRGHQVLNVASGGTLVQDIPSQIQGFVDHYPDVERWETIHNVRLLPGSRLHAILGRDTLAVNSFHHQAVKQLGEGLVVSAYSDDQVVEGIEMPGRRFVIGVQWHPEAFWDHGRDFQPLFEELVRTARQATSSVGPPER